MFGLFQNLPLARASQTWSGPNPVQIGNPIDDLSTAANAPKGQMLVAYETDAFKTGELDIASVAQTNGTGSWSAPTRITTSAQNAYPNLLELSNGTALLFWGRETTKNYQIFYKPYNGFWSPANVQVTFGKLNDTYPSATVDRNGVLWLFWTRGNNTAGTFQLYYKTMTGNVWSADTPFTSGANLNEQPSATVGRDGRIWVSWSSAPASSNFQIFNSVYNGTAWSTPSQLTSSNTDDERPSIMQDRNGTLWTFWGRDVIVSTTLDYFVLFAKFSYDNGRTWLPSGSDLQMTNTGTSVNSLDPFAIQSTAPDKSIWILYTTNPIFAPNIYALKSSPVSLIHDVYISSIQAPTSQSPPQFPGGLAAIGQSPVVSVDVTVANLGDFVESVNVTLTAFNTTSYTVGSIKTTLANGTSTVYHFQWTTTEKVKPGRYGFTATTPALTGETVGNIGGNTLSAKQLVHIIPLGDVDLDGVNDFADLANVFFDFGATTGTKFWNPYADFNNDGIVDFADLAVAAFHLGESG